MSTNVSVGVTVRRCLVPAAAALALAACGGDSSSSSGSPTSEDYDGSFASSAVSGTMTVTVPTGTASLAAPLTGPAPSLDLLSNPQVNVTAVLHLTGGGTVTLTGTLTGVALLLSGSSYSFNGSLTGTGNGRRIEGTFSGPGGSGTFSVVVAGGGSHARTYCGTYSGTDNGSPDNGRFNLVLGSDGTGGAIVASSSGSFSDYLAVRTSGGQLQAYNPSVPSYNIAQTTTYTSTNIAGTYNDGQGASGTFSGSTSACQ